MSGNNSSSTNDSLPSEFSNLSSYAHTCFEFTTSHYLYSVYNFTNFILLLPLSVAVLCVGFQQWKRLRSVSSRAVVSFSDFVTYNMAVMELIGVLANTLSICSAYSNLPVMAQVGIHVGTFPWYGQMFFPILNCAERYLAVVHPITYLRLKQVYGVRIRNISIVAVWLQCTIGVGLIFILLDNPKFILVSAASQITLFLIATAFCSVSALRVLIRPRPGEASGYRVRVAQSKWRAFRTITVIMGVLLLKFGGNLVCNALSASPALSLSAQCFARVSQVLFNVPSSLVLPLLFLHKAGKLPGCKHNTESG